MMKLRWRGITLGRKQEEGGKFLEGYGVGGNNEHVSVNFDIGEDDASGSTRTLIVNKETGEETDYSGNLGSEGQKIAKGESETSYLKFDISFGFNTSDNKTDYSIAAGALTINHETQHLRINHSTLNFGKSRISSYNQHKMMADPGKMYYQERRSFYTQLKPLWYNTYQSMGNKYKNQHEFINSQINGYGW